MLIEHRTYTTRTEATHAFVTAYRDEGLPLQLPIFGAPLAFLTTEVGPLEQVLLIWRFADFADRKAKRVAIAALPEWTAFLGRAAPMVRHHESRLMTAVIPPGLPDAQP